MYPVHRDGFFKTWEFFFSLFYLLQSVQCHYVKNSNMAPKLKSGKLYIRHTLADLCHQLPHSINHSQDHNSPPKQKLYWNHQDRLQTKPVASFQELGVGGEWLRLKNSQQTLPKGLGKGGGKEQCCHQHKYKMSLLKKPGCILRQINTDLSVWLQFYEVQH